MKKLIGLGLCLLFFATSASALDVGVGVKAGTLGAGVDLSVAITKQINLRVSVTGVDIDGEEETISVGDEGLEADVDAELDASFGANALLFDWYVFDGGFHVTAGLMKNNGKIDFSAALRPGTTYTVDGVAFDTTDINGDIGGEVSLGDSYQPYLGIGWGRKAGSDGGFSISAELGVALLDPDAQLEANVIAGGAFADQAALDQTLADAESDVEGDLDDFEAYPVLSIGLNYAF